MTAMITASRYHDFSCGHRVHGHESKCAHLHGHNYRVDFTVAPVADLDTVGRVLDFSDIKTRLCQWLEDNWDHRFLIFSQDPLAEDLRLLDPEGVVIVSFNPTAENMARWLLHVVGPQQLQGSSCMLVQVTVEETRKCLAEATLELNRNRI
jgi:6-pyruvoyltetrahydropterin/6-carboxytetrahydropterin synthase